MITSKQDQILVTGEKFNKVIEYKDIIVENSSSWKKSY